MKNKIPKHPLGTLGKKINRFVENLDPECIMVFDLKFDNCVTYHYNNIEKWIG